MDEVKLILFKRDVEYISEWNQSKHPRLAMCAHIEDDVFHQATSFTSCREVLTNSFGAITTKIATPYNITFSGNALDKNRVMIFFKRTASNTTINRLESALENAKEILNFFEKIGNLELSKVYRTNHVLANHYLIYMFEGDKEWARTPFMLSLYALIMRSGRFMEIGGFRTCEQFIKKCIALKDLYLELRYATPNDKEKYNEYVKRFCGFPAGEAEDIFHLFHVADKIELLMKNKERLFGSVTQEEIYNASGDIDGITNFCKGDVRSHRLTNKISSDFLKLCTEHNLEWNKDPYPKTGRST